MTISRAILIGIFAAYICYVLWKRFIASGQVYKSVYEPDKFDLRFKKLVGACFGDRRAADSLYRFERSRNMSLSDVDAVDLALERLARDRGDR